MNFQLSIVIILIILCDIIHTSQYKGVSYNTQTRKWIAKLHLKTQTPKYGGQFNDELDAAKRVNQLCKELGIPLHNLGISAIPDEKYQKREKTSQYKGVCWERDTGKWKVHFVVKGHFKFGGTFNDELDAAKRVNQLCEDWKIPHKNHNVSAIPNKQVPKKEKTSQYIGVNWKSKSKKWYAQVVVKGKAKYGGIFNDELDAAKSVNQLCKEFGIPLRNPGISAEKYQKKEKTSQYKGVHWEAQTGKWKAYFYRKGKFKFGGSFQDELDAAIKVNKLCANLGIPHRNPTVEAMPNQKHEKDLRNDDTIQAEFTSLISILDKHNDHIATSITKDIFEAINNEEQTIMTQINLRTQNGESALSIAATNGLSNAVKFLISKGAEKHHFTNEHHTPLSLAVSHNHLKVVQVLFEDWISPNSHENPYLHLSPIFNVKSREIAQLLIDNDTVTHEIYNNKNQSPLTVACQNGYLDVVEFFLDDGLEINHVDNDNKTPLFYALTNKHHKIANLLISKGAQN